jgi:hypothetical protein
VNVTFNMTEGLHPFEMLVRLPKQERLVKRSVAIELFTQ